MPAYSQAHLRARPPARARVRAGMMRGLALALGRTRGRPLAPERLEKARILVMRPDHLGDLLFLGPAMRGRFLTCTMTERNRTVMISLDKIGIELW